MALTTVSALATALGPQVQRTRVNKVFATQKGAGRFQSGWLATGFPDAGVAPVVYTNGSGYTADKSTTGALRLHNAAVQNWIARMRIHTSQAGTLLLVDRLWACTGMGFAAATYTVTTPGSLPARITDSGLGCEMWVEAYANLGAASGTLSVNYKDSAGTSQNTVLDTVESGAALGQLQFIPLANNLGVSSVVDVTNSATWTSSSGWGITILKRICEISIAQIEASTDWAAVGIPPIPSDACLMLVWLAQNTVSPYVEGYIDIVDL